MFDTDVKSSSPEHQIVASPKYNSTISTTNNYQNPALQNQ